MKKILFFALFAVIIAVGFFVFLYWNTNVGVDAKLVNYDQASTVEVVHGTVLTKKTTDTEYTLVEGKTNLEVGMMIKVLEDSEGLIHWFDDSISRLDANTELAVTQMDLDPNNQANIKISTRLEEGQMWNKVMNLVHPDAEFSVKVGDTVAGVRGSVVNLRYRNQRLHILSFEHAAFIRHGDLEQTLIAGEGAEVTATGAITVTPLSDEEKNDSWVRDNEQRDNNYLNELRQLTSGRLRGIAGVLPDDPQYFLKRIKEDNEWKSLTSPEDKIRFLFILAKRRLAESTIMFEKNRNDLAQNAIKDFNNVINQIRELLPQVTDEKTRNTFQDTLNELLLIFTRLTNLYQNNDNIGQLTDNLDQQLTQGQNTPAFWERRALQRLYRLDDLFTQGRLTVDQANQRLVTIGQFIDEHQINSEAVDILYNKLLAKINGEDSSTQGRIRRRPRLNPESGSGSENTGGGTDTGGGTQTGGGGTTGDNTNNNQNPPPLKVVGLGEKCGAEIAKCQDPLVCKNGLCAEYRAPLKGKCDQKLLCVEGLICFQGYCRDRLAENEKCTTTSQCLDKLICLGGTCRNPETEIAKIEAKVARPPSPITTQYLQSVLDQLHKIPDTFAARITKVKQTLEQQRTNQINIYKSKLEYLKNQLEMLNKDQYTSEAKLLDTQIKNLETDILLLQKFVIS